MTAPLTRIVVVGEIPAAGRTIRIVPDPVEIAALVAELGLIDLKDLSVDLRLKPIGRDGLRVTGELTASVVQPCVVTLEPVTTRIETPVEATYAPARGDGTDPDADGPDPLVEGRADVGALAREFLVMAIPDYPRKAGLPEPDAADPPPDRASPFADLGERLSRPRTRLE
jgi:hypothetical protein